MSASGSGRKAPASTIPAVADPVVLIVALLSISVLFAGSSCWRGTSVHSPADLAEVTRIYGIRHWIKQSYKQVKDQLGWTDFQVRSASAIRRHQTLVNCAFCFCWDAWFAENPPQRDTAAAQPEPGRGERGPRAAPPAPSWPRALRLAFPVDRAAALVAGMVQGAPPPQLQALLDSVAAGCGLHLYIPN